MLYTRLATMFLPSTRYKWLHSDDVACNTEGHTTKFVGNAHRMVCSDLLNSRMDIPHLISDIGIYPIDVA